MGRNGDGRVEAETDSRAAEADRIRATERERLRLLVEADVSAAGPLHADDFQLVTPNGSTYSKQEYLEAIGSGTLNYVVWEPGAIEVRLYGNAAIIRYQSQMQVIGRTTEIPLTRVWHTDAYEHRDDRWQIVWSQATMVR